MNGIHIIDPKRMVRLRSCHESTHSHSFWHQKKMDSYCFADLQRWAVHGHVFGFLTPKGEIQRHWYKTPQVRGVVHSAMLHYSR